ncbi:MAG: hypothetical protein WDW36_009968 [Sanguina aurantia]
MFDHVTIAVFDLRRSRGIYAAALAPLGYTIQTEITDEPTGDLAALGFGTETRTTFWLVQGRPGSPLHLAFAASNHAAVDAFHAAALVARARDHGAPGPRPQYHADYYAAFVIDPDGYNVEAVCHAFEP